MYFQGKYWEDSMEILKLCVHKSSKFIDPQSQLTTPISNFNNKEHKQTASDASSQVIILSI